MTGLLIFDFRASTEDETAGTDCTQPDQFASEGISIAVSAVQANNRIDSLRNQQRCKRNRGHVATMLWVGRELKAINVRRKLLCLADNLGCRRVSP
jgi:hypothetical protein